MGHYQSDNDEERAPPEPGSHGDELSYTEQQQAAEKRIEQPDDADIALFGGDAPASDNGVGGSHISVGKQPEHIEIESQVECEKGCEKHKTRECHFGEPAYKDCIEEVGQVLPHK